MIENALEVRKETKTIKTTIGKFLEALDIAGYTVYKQRCKEELERIGYTEDIELSLHAILIKIGNMFRSEEDWYSGRLDLELIKALKG